MIKFFKRKRPFLEAKLFTTTDTRDCLINLSYVELAMPVLFHDQNVTRVCIGGKDYIIAIPFNEFVTLYEKNL